MEDKYKSIYTGKQVDDAVGKANTALTQDDILQSKGTNPSKTMSQAAITRALEDILSVEVVNDKISEHNQSESAHPYLQQQISEVASAVDSKASALNDRSQSQQDTYSANYINSNFVPLSFVTNSYAQRETDSTAKLVDTPPTASDLNFLISENTTNTDYDWDTPEFTFTRTLENDITLTRSNSLELSLYFLVSRNANISWGARIKISQDGGDTWTYISSKQAFGAVNYDTSVGNNASLTISTDTVSVGAIYNIGDLLAIEVFKKQADSTALTTTIHCGLTVDNAYICTYAQYNTQNVFINTSQIADGSITKDKLSQGLKDEIDDKLTKQTKTDGQLYAYAFEDDEQYVIPISNAPREGCVPKYDSRKNLQSGNAYYNEDVVNLGYAKNNLKSQVFSAYQIFGTNDLTTNREVSGNKIEAVLEDVNSFGLVVLLNCGEGVNYVATNTIKRQGYVGIVFQGQNATNYLDVINGTEVPYMEQITLIYVTADNKTYSLYNKIPVVSTAVSSSSTNNTFATSKAVYDYVTEVVGNASTLLGNTEDLPLNGSTVSGTITIGGGKV